MQETEYLARHNKESIGEMTLSAGTFIPIFY